MPPNSFRATYLVIPGSARAARMARLTLGSISSTFRILTGACNDMLHFKHDRIVRPPVVSKIQTSYKTPQVAAEILLRAVRI